MSQPQPHLSVFISPLSVAILLLVFCMSAASDAPNLILTGDVMKMQPFVARYEHGHQTKSEGGFPDHWGMIAPDDATSGEVFLDATETHGFRAIGVRKLAGPGPVQLRYDPLALSGGKTYQLTFDYLATGGAAGAARLLIKQQSREKGTSAEYALIDTQGVWKSVTLSASTKGDAEYELLFHGYVTGTEKTIFLKNVALRVVP